MDKYIDYLIEKLKNTIFYNAINDENNPYSVLTVTGTNGSRKKELSVPQLYRWS